MSFDSNYKPTNWRDHVFLQILRDRLSWAAVSGADTCVEVLASEDFDRAEGSRTPGVLRGILATALGRHEGGYWDWCTAPKRAFFQLAGDPFRTPRYYRLIRLLPSDFQDFILARFRARSLAKEAWRIRSTAGKAERVFILVCPYTFRLAAYAEEGSINPGDQT